MYYWVPDIEWKTNGSIGLFFVVISVCRTRVSIGMKEKRLFLSRHAAWHRAEFTVAIAYTST